jgi:hypothetical protein
MPGARLKAGRLTRFARRAPSLPAFFHHERIRRLKSSGISAILTERPFKMK